MQWIFDESDITPEIKAMIDSPSTLQFEVGGIKTYVSNFFIESGRDPKKRLEPIPCPNCLALIDKRNLDEHRRKWCDRFIKHGDDIFNRRGGQ